MTTAAAARTDAHRPASADFDPAAYTFAGAFDGQCPVSNVDRRVAVASLHDRGYSLGHGSSSNCGHCGTAIRYSALLVRDDIQQYIFVGEQCLGNRFDGLSRAEFQRLREQARLNRERATFDERLEELSSKHECVQRLLGNDDVVKGNSFLTDVRNKLLDTARLTENQIAAVGRAFAREEQRKVWAAERAERQRKIAAERAAAVAAGVTAPEGRVTVTGEIVSVKWHDHLAARRGWRTAGTYKAVIKTDEGWSCWLSLPKEVSAGDAKGKRISVIATLTRSDRDQTFAFGKRPTLVSVA